MVTSCVCSHWLSLVFTLAISCVHAHLIATCQVLDADEVSSRVDEGHPPVHPNQLACADVVLLNKCDLVDAHHLDSAAAYLAGAIPGVEVSTPSAIAHTHGHRSYTSALISTWRARLELHVADQCFYLAQQINGLTDLSAHVRAD